MEDKYDEKKRDCGTCAYAPSRSEHVPAMFAEVLRILDNIYHVDAWCVKKTSLSRQVAS